MAVSCGCVIAALMLLGLHFMLLEQNFDPKSLEWLPIVAMILFMLMSIGIVPVPTTMLSELFPDDLKSLAGFTASITSALFAFISSRTYQPLIDLMSEKYVFWMYAFIMGICLVYSIVEMPETKGKTLQVNSIIENIPEHFCSTFHPRKIHLYSSFHCYFINLILFHFINFYFHFYFINFINITTYSKSRIFVPLKQIPISVIRTRVKVFLVNSVSIKE